MGSVTLGVRVGHQVSHISSGVVPNTSVPVILGNTSYDHKTKSIRAEDQEVLLRSREVGPILRGACRSPRYKSRRDTICACPRGDYDNLTLAHGATVAPATVDHVKVRGDFKGHGRIRGKETLYPIHGVQLAEGPAVFNPGQPQTVQLLNPT